VADNPYKTSSTASQSSSSKDSGHVTVRLIASVLLGGASFFPLLLGIAWVVGGASGGPPAAQMIVAGIGTASLGALIALISARLFLDRRK